MDRRYTYEPCECGDPWCAGCEDADVSDMEEVFGEPISVYTRAQAIADGTLVDVTEWASADKGFHGGFKYPVAVTRALWNVIEYIPPKAVTMGQDVRGRAHDVLFMASLAARRGGQRVEFSVRMHVREGIRVLHLVGDCGPGDNGEPVITIGYPEDF
jgi:hypothetical protein